MTARPVAAFLLALSGVIAAAAVVPGCTVGHVSDSFKPGDPGPHSSTLPVSISCDVGGFVHTMFPTMADVEVVVRFNGATRRAWARMGSYTWDGAETVVSPQAPPVGVLEVLEPDGPVSLACVSYSGAQTLTSAVLRPEAGATSTTVEAEDPNAFRAGPPGGNGRG